MKKKGKIIILVTTLVIVIIICIVIGVVYYKNNSTTTGSGSTVPPQQSPPQPDTTPTTTSTPSSTPTPNPAPTPPTPTPTPPSTPPPTPPPTLPPLPLPKCPTGTDTIDNKCYAPCTTDYTIDLGNSKACHKSCPDGWKDDGNGTCTTESTQLNKYSTTRGVPNQCQSGYTLKGAICYKNCDTNYDSDGVANCYEKCPSDWKGTTSITHCQHNTIYSPSKTMSQFCPASNPNLFLSLCYPPLPDGYTMSSAGLATRKCAAGERDDGINCWKDNYLGVGTIPNIDIYGKGCCCTVFGCCNNCKSGYTDDGCTCRGVTCPSNRPNNVAGLCYPSCPAGYSQSANSCIKSKIMSVGGAVTPTLKCNTGDVQKGALCYSPCGSGYERRDDNIEYCSTICPTGFTNIGIGGCTRPVVVTPTSPTNCGDPTLYENKNGLCYEICPKGVVLGNNGSKYDSERRSDDIEYCRPVCPPGFTYKIGGSCYGPTANRVVSDMVVQSS